MEDLYIKPGTVVPADAMQASYARAGGPGGQHVNKTSTRALLRFDPSKMRLPRYAEAKLRTLAGSRLTQEGIVVLSSQDHRSQKKNLEECRQRLRSMLLEAYHRPKARRATKPSRASQARRMDKKTQRSQLKKSRGKVKWD